MQGIRNAVANILRHIAFYLTAAAELIAVSDKSLDQSMTATLESRETTDQTRLEEEEEEEDEDCLLPERMRKESLLSSDSGIDYEIPDFLTGKDEETGLDFISLEEVSFHSCEEDAWMVVYDKVYEMTEYLESHQHPGGQDVIVEYLGHDATLAFRGVGHSKPAMKILEKYCIGILPHDERLNFSSHL